MDEKSNISLEEAVGALRTIKGSVRTIARRAEAENDRTSILVLGVVDTGKQGARTAAIVGDEDTLIQMIALVMHDDPDVKRIFTEAVALERDM